MPRPNWIQTYTGTTFTFDDLDSNVYRLKDIAHALSMQCRFNGHCRRFYSVAEHCLLMHDAYCRDEEHAPLMDAERETPLMGLHILLHDAAEAYVGDTVTALKSDLAIELEDQILTRVYRSLRLPLPTAVEAQIVREYDLRILVTEVDMLMLQGVDYPEWDHLPPEGVSLSFEDCNTYRYDAQKDLRRAFIGRVSEELAAYREGLGA